MMKEATRIQRFDLCEDIILSLAQRFTRGEKNVIVYLMFQYGGESKSADFRAAEGLQAVCCRRTTEFIYP